VGAKVDWFSILRFSVARQAWSPHHAIACKHVAANFDKLQLDLPPNIARDVLVELGHLTVGD
jgi:hypothetical protein